MVGLVLMGGVLMVGMATSGVAGVVPIVGVVVVGDLVVMAVGSAADTVWPGV